ncbi:hypothetical protein CPC16_010766 [Podila verticillata]|nr:hypothetical protein CPC16_010766 [Podila verticillata]
MVEDPYEEESDMEEDVMEVEEGVEEDADDAEDAEEEVEDAVNHIERVLWEYGSDDDKYELHAAPAPVPARSRYSPRRTRAGTVIDH